MAYTGPTDLYIDGEWTTAETGDTIDTLNPATEDHLASVASGGAADIDRAVTAAEDAVAHDSDWRRLSPGDRADHLFRVAEAIDANKEQIIETESLDNGKTPFEARIDVNLVVDTFTYFAGWADKIHGEHVPVPGNRLNYTRREPVGVTGHIAPWNYPFYLAGRSLAPALVCGNTAVLKPSSTTPLSAYYYAQAAEAADLPDGVLNVVPGTGSDAGSALASHTDIDHIAFTGSTEVGKQVMADAATNVTDVTLELGGKGPNIVFPDADLDAAAKGIQYGIFMNAGQMCWAGSRLLVHESVHDELVERVVQRAEAIPLGSGLDDDARMGPLVSATQQESVLDYIELGVEAGATIETGGGVPADKNAGYFVEPTVFTDVTNEMQIAREEIFGPVLVVIPFESKADAVRLANDSPYGLMADLWTQDVSRAHTVAHELDYGMVTINEAPITFPQTPFGGYKESGSGREQGREAIQEYTQAKNITLNLG